MRARLRRLLAAVTCIILTLVAVVPAAGAADDVAFTWNDPRLLTPSGMGTDADHSVYWVSNAGASATTSVYAVTGEGRTSARLVMNVPATAVEAVAYQGGRVWLADIGDPFRTRKLVSIISAQVTNVADATVAYRAWDFTYPDGARDAEAMLVGPNGQIYLITKGASPGVYKAPAAPVATKPNALTRVADAPADVTDATFVASGRVVVRTASEVIEIDPATWQVVAKAALPEQKGGKSLTTTLDGTALLAAGQGTGTGVVKVGLPSAPVSSTPAAAAPEPTASATPTPAPTAGGDDRSGTVVALVIAGLVAVIAASYTLIRR